MKILVLGAGVLGVSSAWYLAKSGHEVTVVERRSGVADETSYGNAGMLSYGYCNPWAAPGIPFKAVKWMMQDLAPIMVSPSAFNVSTSAWMLKMLGQCGEDAYRINKNRMLRITEYSRICFDQLQQDRPIHYDQRHQGTVELFRDQEKMDSIGADLESLRECGVEHQVIDHATCIQHEPALANVSQKFVGGLMFPNDGTGDCRKFTQGLAAACRDLGVIFMMDTEVKGLEASGGEIHGVVTSKGRLTADKYVVAMGSYSPMLMNPLGIKLPIYPIKGYSLTLPLLDESKAPQSTVMDEEYKVAVTRFDERIRVGGTAEIASFDLSLKESRRKAADFVVSDLFPGAGDLEKAEFWCGLRPMTPDSVPIIGKTPFNNLYLNTGHGTLGWTMSQGSARLLADIVNERDPDISTEGLSVHRYL
ncbi:MULTISPECIES: D-amino acid dehydrogenase [unclassified Oceanobacter]|jgi:D-amino-acid dehydrogenase|uniref:D-amino acid dehydrogenase n=1 Tax=unclassified Oceanobacter TaxID=2620260 RepID=UPI0026E477E8|nr:MULTISPECIES: D-amino acid dehydrogenase [unclassified Oceanobacter]MDO6682702.1 D-amino acid dehydrogenase [Oceanobacter sp. 5_MG-2023]MDP2507181.1 D-amino acid dehydrogenase [Oceanobacter sp. 3_MG-2023]MDP2609059.1 D-amino acid dehydrogenase [Oceanobacter sp. 1_MG-2023]MDP2612381.1 D-amino acid dehydrogenase [Oceanobacter sp. 2_MG-2023]